MVECAKPKRRKYETSDGLNVLSKREKTVKMSEVDMPHVHNHSVPSEQECPESKLIISSAGGTIISSTALSTAAVLQDIISVGLRPRSLEFLDTIVVTVQQLTDRTNHSPPTVRDLGHGAVLVRVCGIGDVVAGIVFGHVFGTEKHVSRNTGGLRRSNLTLPGFCCSEEQKDLRPGYSSAVPRLQDVQIQASHGLGLVPLLGFGPSPYRSLLPCVSSR